MEALTRAVWDFMEESYRKGVLDELLRRRVRAQPRGRGSGPQRREGAWQAAPVPESAPRTARPGWPS